MQGVHFAAAALIFLKRRQADKAASQNPEKCFSQGGDKVQFGRLDRPGNVTLRNDNVVPLVVLTAVRIKLEGLLAEGNAPALTALIQKCRGEGKVISGKARNDLIRLKLLNEDDSVDPVIRGIVDAMAEGDAGELVITWPLQTGQPAGNN